MWWWVAGGCSGDPTDKAEGTSPTETETGTIDTETTPTGPTGSTGDTGGTSGYSVPTSITADCAPLYNELRFTCHVTVDPPQPVQIAFSKSDGTGAERVHASVLEAADHDIGLYFMAPHTAYAFTATATAFPEGPAASGEVITGNPPIDLSAFLEVTGTSTTPYVGTNLSCGGGANGAVFDTATGELLWYQVADPTGQFGGYQMIQFTEDHTLLGQSGGQVMEIDLMGADLLRKFKGVDYFDDLHHDLFKHEGQYYLLYHEGSVLLDGFLIWDASGTEVGRWFSGDSLEIPIDAAGDWMHTNTIFVRDGFVYLSSFQQNTVFKIDGDLASPTFGAPQWFLAGAFPSGLGNSFAVDWSLVDGVDGFNHQHDLNLTADGRVLMLDNQHGRALVVALDEAAGTATVSEAYPTSSGTCGPQGTAKETAAGDFLVDCSGMSLLEYAPGGATPVWTAELRCENGTSGGGPSDSPERWYPLEGW